MGLWCAGHMCRSHLVDILAPTTCSVLAQGSSSEFSPTISTRRRAEPGYREVLRSAIRRSTIIDGWRQAAGAGTIQAADGFPRDLQGTVKVSAP
jgi:hypothetical protein